MERSKIKPLLTKYLEGETSLSEEKILNEYFASGKVDPTFEEYKPLFNFFEEQRKTAFEGEVNLPEKKSTFLNKKYYRWSAIAASVLIVCSVYFFNQKQTKIKSTEVNHELAMKHTQDLLYMMTNVMNDGKKQLQYLNEFNTTQNQIIQQK
ncbi:hypothetical protein [Mesonia maritima]|uniref:Anti-sigma factor n=1 Tax=Mesonia maritima TaxID=1793873 RepID=A0ABU1K564_9FLAO|nr:hypothetical protein [Mesonia maritima]MDR6300750.1 hypothetical protein [Mesonia maritima]